MTDNNESVEMWCPNCKIVLDVHDKGNGMWYVEDPEGVDQNQFSVEGPLCVKALCVISETRGLLSNEPIPVELG